MYKRASIGPSFLLAYSMFYKPYMDVKKWVFCVLLTTFMIMLVGLRPPNDFVMTDSSNEEQSSLTWALKNIIQDIPNHESWAPRHYEPAVSSNSSSTKKKLEHFGVSPNLTSCHESITEWNQPAYCCPPNHQSTVSEEPFIDFEFPDASAPVRVRRPAHLVDREYIVKYTKAVSIMKSLPYDDPRNFIRQADMHCLYCTGSYNQKHSNSVLKIHESWMFFPWHRMVLYFHERILGSFIGDDTFALPFWNWDDPHGMVIPEMYMNMNATLYDKERNRAHLAPQVTDNNYNFVENGLTPDDQMATNVALMYHQMVSGAKKPELFMGCPYKAGEDGFCNGPGTIEAAPHNPLHMWVGNPLNTQSENLGAFYAAARDPLFYAHHSNIDRLWEVWEEELRGGGDSKTPAFDDLDWLDSYFYFHNENSQLVRIKVRDVLDVTKLKYTYQKVENQWLNARPKPSVPPKIARKILVLNHSNYYYSSAPKAGQHGQHLDTTIRVRVHRPKTHRTQKEKDEQEEVLVVYGIDIKKDMYVKFDVYVNAVDETNIGPESREFAGTFVKMRKGVKRLVIRDKGDVTSSVNKRKTKLKLGISELLEDLEADGDESILVTLVPRGGTCVNTTIDGIRIEYLQ